MLKLREELESARGAMVQSRATGLQAVQKLRRILYRLRQIERGHEVTTCRCLERLLREAADLGARPSDLATAQTLLEVMRGADFEVSVGTLATQLVFTVAATTTVQDLAERVGRALGWEIPYVMLVFNNEPLTANHQTLEEVGVSPHDCCLIAACSANQTENTLRRLRACYQEAATHPVQQRMKQLFGDVPAEIREPQHEAMSWRWAMTLTAKAAARGILGAREAADLWMQVEGSGLQLEALRGTVREAADPRRDGDSRLQDVDDSFVESAEDAAQTVRQVTKSATRMCDARQQARLHALEMAAELRDWAPTQDRSGRGTFAPRSRVGR